MLKQHRAIALVMTFVMCLSFLAPSLIAPDAAEAAMTATVSQSNYVPAADSQDLGYVKVEVNVSDWSAPTVVNSELLVSYPTRIGVGTNTSNTTGAAIGATVSGAVGVGDTYTAANTSALALRTVYGVALDEVVGDSGIRVVIPNDADNAFEYGAAGRSDIELSTIALAAAGAGGGVARNGALTLRVNNVTNTTKTTGWFYIYFADMNVANYAGDVNVTLVPQAGTAFGNSPSPLVVGKVQISSSTTTTAKSVTKITSAGGTIDTITCFENMPNSVSTGNISLEIVTKGYTWSGTGAAVGLFGFAGGGATIAAPALAGSDEIINFNVTASPATTVGAISFAGLGLLVDEKVAKVGQDVEVKISGASVTEQTVTVATYVDFIANVIEDTTTELTAGLAGQKLGTFFIEEIAPGTLIANRTILFELPAGCEWGTAVSNAGMATSNFEIVNNSAITFNAGNLLDNRTLKFTVNTTSAAAQNGAKIKFKGLRIDVSPAFTGDVNIAVSGKAGVEGTVKVATVNPMIKMEASAPELALGIKEQKASDVTVTEQKVDTILSKLNGTAQDMAFYLDAGFRFAKVPKVEVVEGDMVVETSAVKIEAPANGQNRLIIPIRAASYKTAAKIKISEIYITADRNAPTGDVLMWAADTNNYPNVSWNESKKASFRYDTAGSVAIATNVTVPPAENKEAFEGGSGTFVIGSNLYTVNGLTKFMDAAPYVKNDRTYVPYRYLALALGVADADIAWDSAAQKVTVTKGSTVVEATIGSTTLTVNGEAKTMDVAPEISSDRTMLPARYLAEALGANVGWDPATKTVVFEF